MLCLEMIQNMVYAHLDETYNGLHNQFVKDCTREVVQYFDSNWHCIRKEWVIGLKYSCGSFLNTTNNRLESINGKQVMTK